MNGGGDARAFYGSIDRADRNAAILERLSWGWSSKRIARELGCATVTIQAVRQGRSVSHGRLL